MTEELERPPDAVIERALDAAREMLGMDLIYARGLSTETRARIGAFVSVPVITTDGEQGSLCAFGQRSDEPLGEREIAFLGVLAQLISDQIEREREHKVRVDSAFRAALLAALEARDGYTGEHFMAVVDLALTTGFRLGLRERSLADLETVALLHDVGKLAVPDAILRKPGALDDAEWEQMRQHVVSGAEIVEEMPTLAHLAPAIRASHERWDGGGYPDGLSGAGIPMESRIVFVCDAYHAMVSAARTGGARRGRERALAEIERCMGSQFCPDCAAAVLEALAERAAA